MTQHRKVIDAREAWLDGISLEASQVLAKLKHREIKGITLTAREKSMEELCSGYIYMLSLCKDYGLFDSDDPFNLFKKETLH